MSGMATTEKTVTVPVADLDALLEGWATATARLRSSDPKIVAADAAWRRLWELCPPVDDDEY